MPNILPKKGKRLDPPQVSYHRLSLLSYPGVRLVPFLKTFEPFFIAFHTLEQGSLSLFLEFDLRFEQYLLLSTLAQIESFSVWNLQLSFARRARFFPLVDCNPNPPPSPLGFVTLCHPIQWIFLVVSVEPHKKF